MNCQKDECTDISWKCTPDHKMICDDMNVKWLNLKEYIVLNLIIQALHCWCSYKCKPKKGEVVERLKAVKKEASLKFSVDFIDSF